MREFADYVRVVLRHEGGYTNNKSDPGGATNYGISFRFLYKYGIDINNDGEVNVKDITDLTINDAIKLYYNYFWSPMNLGNINNELLKLHLFDMGVNAGTKTAVKILQRMLGTVPDGIIGNNTLNAIQTYKGNIVSDYMSARKEYYIRIIEKNPKLGIFRRGWFRRVNTTYFK